MRLVLTMGAVLLGSSLAGEAQTVEIHGGNGVVLGAPPVVLVKPVTDTVGGHTITDNYRWLEDQKAADTRAYIAAQTAYSDTYFAQIKPLHDRLMSRLTELSRVDTIGIPSEQHGRFFYSKRLAAENQSSIYMRQGLHGQEVKLVDAAALSTDGNTSVAIEDTSGDGKLLAYSIRHGGADEGLIRFLDVDARKNLGDELPLARYDGFSLIGDATGKMAYYAKVLDGGNSAVFKHVLGESVEKDVQIFPAADGSFRGQKLGPLDLISCSTSENDHWLIVSIAHGVPATREDILMQDLRKPGATLEPLVYGIDSRFSLEMAGDRMFVRTDYNAPNGQVLRARLGDPTTKSWTVVIPEGKSPIDALRITGGRMFVGRLADVKSETTIYDLPETGLAKQTGTIEYPTIGTGSVVFGREYSKIGFYTFSSFTVPPTIYQYDIASGKTSVWNRSRAPFDSDRYEVKQVFYTSKDGTRIPMFIAGRKGLAMDGTAPMLMTGYGGFPYLGDAGLQCEVRVVDGAGRVLRAAQPARRR